MTYTIKLGCTAEECVIRDADSEILWPGKDGWADYQAWRAAGNTPTPPPPEPLVVKEETVPDSISRRQFYQHYANFWGDITKEEALAAVSTGTIPKLFVDSVINAAATEEDKFELRMYLAGAAKIERHHRLMNFIGERLGMASHEWDVFFTDASRL